MGTGFKTLFLNTIHKELRSKTLYFLFAFTALLIIMVNLAVGYLYNEVLDANTSQMVGDKTATFVYLVVDFWSTFLCIMFGVNTINSDKSSGVIGQILSFPVKRSTYLSARVLGSTFIVFSYHVISVLLAMALFSITTDKMIGGVEILYALVPSLLNIFILILLSMNFALYLPKMMAFVGMVFLTLFIVLSNKVYMLKSFEEYFSDLGAIKSISLLFHLFFPRIGIVSSGIGNILFGGEIEFNLIGELIHLVVILSIWIYMSIFLLKKEDY